MHILAKLHAWLIRKVRGQSPLDSSGRDWCVGRPRVHRPRQKAQADPTPLIPDIAGLDRLLTDRANLLSHRDFSSLPGLLSLGFSAWDVIPAQSPFRNPHVWLELQFYCLIRRALTLGEHPDPESTSSLGHALATAVQAYELTTGSENPPPGWPNITPSAKVCMQWLSKWPSPPTGSQRTMSAECSS